MYKKYYVMEGESRSIDNVSNQQHLMKDRVGVKLELPNCRRMGKADLPTTWPHHDSLEPVTESRNNGTISVSMKGLNSENKYYELRDSIAVNTGSRTVQFTIPNTNN
jgi:hypothetical protein